MIASAIEYAAAAGFDVREITPDDFALQRSPDGWSHATHVGIEFVITATIDPDGLAWTNAGDIDWRDQDDDEDCDDGEGEDDEDGLINVYLPGVAPAGATLPPPEQIENALRAAAVRDENGVIRRRRDGLYIAAADVTAEQLTATIAALFPGESRRERSHRELYQLAIELLESEAAEAVTVNA
ncbi:MULTISPECIES: hypothetical protein [Nocardia]|uniref:hypothetical protein n=1 Tax=Nocardia TaxID=1817 RepID=UPI0011B1C791|nr:MULTISPECIES: hypothetical protein [Nocardia]